MDGAGVSKTIATTETGGVHTEHAELVASTAAIGKLVSNSGVDIGDVDVLSLPALVAGTAEIGSVKIAANGKTRVSQRVALSASQTGATVWDPTTGKKFVLTKLVVSCKTAGDVDFFDQTDSGNTVVTPIITMAIGGTWTAIWQLDMPYTSATADNILMYTSGSGFTGSAYVEGWEV